MFEDGETTVSGSLASSVPVMVFIRFSIVAAVLALFSGLYGGLAAPTHQLDERARDVLSRATPAPPHWVIYSDKWHGTSTPPPTSAVSGYNV